MRNLVLKVIINAIAIAITAWLLPGIHVVNNDIGTYLLVGLVFGIVNALIKPLISCLTCAVIILTLGLFLLVINGLMLWITAEILSSRLTIDNFWWAMLGGLIMAVVGTALEAQFGLRDKENDKN
jgi:putative membrane protein